MANDPTGWIPAYRTLFEPDHHLRTGEACESFAWLDVINLTAYRRKNVGSVSDPIWLNPGEVIVSVRALGERWRWGKRRVSRFLAALEEVGKLEKLRVERSRAPGTQSGTVYRVVSWADYAVGASKGGTQSGTQIGTQVEAKDRAEPRDNTGAGGAASGTQSGTQTGRTRDAPRSHPYREMREGKRTRERERTRSRASALSSGWAPSEKHRELAVELRVDVDAEADAFRDWCLANGKTYRDWEAAFRNWIRKARDFGRTVADDRQGGFWE